MIGSYTIRIENAFVRYEFTIKRNITVIRGNSATGKTTLVEMIRLYDELEKDSGISIISEKACVTLSGRNWKRDLKNITDSIVFIDEGERFPRTAEFASIIKGSDNYYVIITRSKLSNLPYSIDEIYGIRESGRYQGLKGFYTLNEFYHIYGVHPEKTIEPQIVITEDSNSGYDFFCSVCQDKNLICKSAGGKSNVFSKLKSFRKENVLVIVDGAAFGPEMEEIMEFTKTVNSNIHLFAPESFEFLLLSSDIFQNQQIQKQLEETFLYADSKDYFSWEQFYTSLLIEISKNTQGQYTKVKLNKFYLSMRNKKIILEQIPDNIGL